MAKETVKQYAPLLQSYGFEVDVDDANEDLTLFYFNENKSSGTVSCRGIPTGSATVNRQSHRAFTSSIGGREAGDLP
jgi:hypothetical protein